MSENILVPALNPGNEPCRLCLEGEMSIYRAVELKKTILASLDQAAILELDLSAVTEMDTAGIQFLMMTRDYARIDPPAVKSNGENPL